LKKVSKKTNWPEVAIGAGLIAVTILDVIPGDELAGIPIGLGLIAHGFGSI
jgi:hypothetical protein